MLTLSMLYCECKRQICPVTYRQSKYSYAVNKMMSDSSNNSPGSVGESQPLLSRFSVSNNSFLHHSCTHFCYQLLKHICLPSKAAVVLICLTVVVGAMNTIFSGIIVVSAATLINSHFIDEPLVIFVTYLCATIAVVLYPVSGFLADVFCGRYRVVMISMCFFIVSFILLSGAAALVLEQVNLNAYLLSRVKLTLFIMLVILFGITFGIGVRSYHANFIQFGLDQLMEAPSEYLSLFIHWIVWADSLPSAVIIPLFATLSCQNHFTVLTKIVISCVPFVCFVALIFLVVFSCWKRRWFYAERRQQNPYKMVIKVLNFARKNKYPLQRSAFTYCDDERPSRLDFGKERFGGPFTTEQVEDVKTFLRILLILLVLGPVFVLDAPNSLFLLPLIGIHIAHQGKHYCDAGWIVVESGSLKYIVIATLSPLYICFMSCYLRKKLPRIFTRLTFGMSLFWLGVLSILISDVVGHAQYEGKVNESLCLFDIEYKNLSLQHSSLDMHWTVLIPVNIFLGIGPYLVTTTTFEFISAQSPETMKGLIIGVFYTIRGFFGLVSSLVLIPFSLKSIWNSSHMKEHPPVTNCGFGYLSSICVVALIGLVLFSIVAKNYKYRERDDRPYDQRFVVDFYSRYI